MPTMKAIKALPNPLPASDAFEDALEWMAAEPEFTVEGFHRAYAGSETKDG
jgi:hypothetical protein